MCSFCLQQILTSLKLTTDLGIHLYFMPWIPAQCFDHDFHKSRFGKAAVPKFQDGRTWGGYSWDNKWELYVLLYLLLLWRPHWSDKVSLDLLRLKWHQLPGCGHHSSHTSFPLNSEGNSLDRTPGLKSEGCPVPQRQWWDVMASQCTGSLQYPPGLCSDFEGLPPLNAYSKMICRFLWRCSGEEKLSITKEGEKKKVKIHFQLNFEKSMRQQNMRKLFQMARTYLRNFI